MLKDRYTTEVSSDFQTFEFVSSGPKGDITKVIIYSEINVRGYYNLGFGDRDPDTGNVSDIIITNNGDSQKVLATVAATLYTFTDNYPDAVIIATGSTEARTRLYKMGISTNFEEISKDFIVFGLCENEWEQFQKSITYTAFLAMRRK